MQLTLAEPSLECESGLIFTLSSKSVHVNNMKYSFKAYETVLIPNLITFSGGFNCFLRLT